MHSVQPDPGLLNEALAAAQRGDLAAFNMLVLAYQRQVFNVCYRTLGNGDDAADAAQDAFLERMRGIKSFRGTTTASPLAAPGRGQRVLRPVAPAPATPVESLDALGDAPTSRPAPSASLIPARAPTTA